MNNLPCVLTIAGTDPSGGAGIQADIKAISANNCYAASVITALVAQNTTGVQAIEKVSPEFLLQQLNSVFSDLDISAVKIGMLHNELAVEIVASTLEKVRQKNIVLDPVMVAKNGCALLDTNKITYLKERLFPIVDLITPNLFETEKLLGRKTETLKEMEFAAQELGKMYDINVLVKGGHLDSDQSTDVLYLAATASFHWFHAKRIHTKNTHGTGCTLSSAIAAYLAHGFSLPKAIKAAKDYLTNAILAGSLEKIGNGSGPVNHFYFLESLNHDICTNE